MKNVISIILFLCTGLLPTTKCFQPVYRILLLRSSKASSELVDMMIGATNDNHVDSELIQDDDDEMFREDYAWIPDKERARIARENSWKHAEADLSTTFVNIDMIDEHEISSSSSSSSSPDVEEKRQQRFTYTEEEEELISILGGKGGSNPNAKREIGFLGDSSLREISMDFQIPICYLGDVLCSWGVPPPIDPNTMLGDMVTGEQAFAILEAIHTLDVGSLNDRYAECDLATLCNEYDIELSDGFELAMKEGWNLPFGVRTFLRVEQEDFLIDTLAKDIW